MRMICFKKKKLEKTNGKWKGINKFILELQKVVRMIQFMMIQQLVFSTLFSGWKVHTRMFYKWYFFHAEQ